MNYECIEVPVLKRLYVDTSKCTFLVSTFLFFLNSDTIPLEKDRAILASRMKRILRIPKRIYDGIKNSEQFQKAYVLELQKDKLFPFSNDMTFSSIYHVQHSNGKLF